MVKSKIQSIISENFKVKYPQKSLLSSLELKKSWGSEKQPPSAVEDWPPPHKWPGGLREESLGDLSHIETLSPKGDLPPQTLKSLL